MDANFIFGLIFMTGTGGSIYGIELYLSFCVVIMGLSCTLVFVGYLGRFIMWFSKNYKMFVRIRDIGRGRLC